MVKSISITGAEKVNRGEGSFSTMIRAYSDVQGKLRYGSEFLWI